MGKVETEPGRKGHIALGKILASRANMTAMGDGKLGADLVGLGDPFLWRDGVADAGLRIGAVVIGASEAKATDIAAGDLLTTSGVDGVYPPGLPVARVVQIDKQVGSSFMRIRARPVARVDGALHVLVLAPAADAPPSPLAAPPTGAAPGGDAPVKGGAP